MNELDANAKSIFFDALEAQSAQELPAFLDEACGGDSELRSRVEELVRAHREAGNFLGGVAAEETPLGHPDAHTPSAQIGPYPLIEQIREGGFCVVFMAEQRQ